MCALLNKPENRCAAITMLGKTVELCYQQLREHCAPAKKEGATPHPLYPETPN